MIGTEKRIRIKTHPHFGDNLACTGAVRNVKAAYPGYRFICPDDHRELWYNNRDAEQEGDADVELYLKYGPVSVERFAGNGNMVDGFTKILCDGLGIEQVQHVTRRPVLILTDEEKEASRAWNGRWLINTNCQVGSLSKGYPHWQEVADALAADGFDLVQVGGNDSRDISVSLRGVEDRRGKTSKRDFIVMVYGCRGVLSPPSAITNVAGAFDKPQVVVAASREAFGMTDYVNAVHVGHKHGCGFGVDTGCVCLGLGNRQCPFMVCDNTGRPWCPCQIATPAGAVIQAAHKAAELAV